MQLNDSEQKGLTLLSIMFDSDTTVTEAANELHISPVDAHRFLAAIRCLYNTKTNMGALKHALIQHHITLTNKDD